MKDAEINIYSVSSSYKILQDSTNKKDSINLILCINNHDR